MKITFLDTKTVGDIPELAELNQFGTVEFFQTTLSSEVTKRIKNSDVIITNKVILDRKVIDKTVGVKLICVAATGMNNIDLVAAKERGIEVRNVKAYSTDSVAQHTFAMLFHLANHLAYYDKYVKSKKYSNQKMFTCLDRPFYELKGKKMGIIGLGTIGQRVAELASSFGADVVYYSTSGKNNHAIYKRVELEELLKTSHIVSIHAPLNDATTNLIGHDQLKLMKKEAILLNTGRGGIVNEKDLVKILNKRLILAAGIDVYEQEPLSKTHPFHKIKFKESLLLTPHIAWSSIEARGQLIKGVCGNIRDFINNKKSLV